MLQQRDQRPDRAGRDDGSDVLVIGNEVGERQGRVRLATGIAVLQQRHQWPDRCDDRPSVRVILGEGGECVCRVRLAWSIAVQQQQHLPIASAQVIPARLCLDCHICHL